MAPSFISSLNFQWSSFSSFLLFLFPLLSPENSGREKSFKANKTCLWLSLSAEGEGKWEREMKKCFTPIALPDFSSSLVAPSAFNNLKLQSRPARPACGSFSSAGKESGRERDEKMLHPCCSPGFLAWWRHLLSMASNSIKASNNFQIF